MTEAKLTSELTNLLRRLWAWPEKHPDLAGQGIYPVGGKPDIIDLLLPVVIEVKVMTGPTWTRQALAFSRITPEQRRWLSAWLANSRKTGAGAQAYLAVGTAHGRAGSNTNRRYAWLVPWERWLEVEARLRPHRNSLPFIAFKGQKPKAVQEQGLNAVRLLEPWALEWRDGLWHLPPGHELTTLLLPVYFGSGERAPADWQNLWRHADKEDT